MLPHKPNLSISLLYATFYMQHQICYLHMWKKILPTRIVQERCYLLLNFDAQMANGELLYDQSEHSFHRTNTYESD